MLLPASSHFSIYVFDKQKTIGFIFPYIEKLLKTYLLNLCKTDGTFFVSCISDFGMEGLLVNIFFQITIFPDQN